MRRKGTRGYRAVQKPAGWYVQGEELSGREVWEAKGRRYRTAVLAGPFATRAQAEAQVRLWQDRQLAIQQPPRPPDDAPAA